LFHFINVVDLGLLAPFFLILLFLLCGIFPSCLFPYGHEILLKIPEIIPTFKGTQCTGTGIAPYLSLCKLSQSFLRILTQHSMSVPSTNTVEFTQLLASIYLLKFL
jgi:hypothetical protein